jgi:tetratricopeptide (TPR) repeat protein
VPLVALHEFGHALIARVVGLRVHRIQIGSGALVAKRRWLGFDVRLHRLVLGGRTYLATANPRGYRLRMWCAVAGGPLTHVLGLALALLFANRPYWTYWQGDAISQGPAPLEILIFLETVLLLGNLAPLKVRGGIQSDGLSLLLTPFLRRKTVRSRLALDHVLEVAFALQEDRRADAEASLTAGLREHPEDAMLQLQRASLEIERGETEAALSSITTVRARKDLSAPIRALADNLEAWALHWAERRDRTEEALERAYEAAKLLPLEPSLASTLGAVLLDCGRAAEALPHLERALDHTDRPRSRATLLCNAARAIAALGDGLQGRALLDKARALDPGCPHLVRGERDVALTPKVTLPGALPALRLAHNRGFRRRLTVAVPVFIVVFIVMSGPNLATTTLSRWSERIADAQSREDSVAACTALEHEIDRWVAWELLLLRNQPVRRAELRGDLADLASCAGRPADAERILRNSIVALDRESEGIENSDIALAYSYQLLRLGGILEDHGSPEEAESVLRRAIGYGHRSITLHAKGDWPSGCYCADLELASFLENQGRLSEALGLLAGAKAHALAAGAPRYVVARLDRREQALRKRSQRESKKIGNGAGLQSRGSTEPEGRARQRLQGSLERGATGSVWAFPSAWGLAPTHHFACT